MRRVGHRLYAQLHITVDPELTTAQSHAISEQLRHALFYAIPGLAETVVHVDPRHESDYAPHQFTALYERALD